MLVAASAALCCFLHDVKPLHWGGASLEIRGDVSSGTGEAHPDLGLPYTAFCGLGSGYISQPQEMDGGTKTKWIFPWATSGFALTSNWLRDFGSCFPYLTLTVALAGDEKIPASLQVSFLSFSPKPML